MARREDFDVFLDKFKPIEHPKEKDFYMYETYGEEYEAVQKHNNDFGVECIWTVVNGRKSNLYLTPGFRFINRFGYVLTTIPWDLNQRDYKY